MTWLLSLALLAAPADYARPELLVEADALAQQLEATNPPLLLDCRPLAEYQAGHIPGAVHLDAAAWAKAVGDGTDASGWSVRISAVGITADRKIVIYDAVKSLDASRIWWVLRYWGVSEVRILNGGWRAWTATKSPVQQAVNSPQATSFTAKAQADRFADKQTVLQSLDPMSLQIVDARSEGENCGTKPVPGTRAGAIPGAKHLDWELLIDPKTHKFLPADELAKRMANAGIDLKAKSVTHCQAGGRSSVMAFALELMGADPARNYHAGWAEWGRDAATPVFKKP